MSRGPGRWQRMILDALSENPGGGVAITGPHDAPAVKSAARRAANRLEADGKIALVSQRVHGIARLVAYAPENAPKTVRTPATGIDGKTYRRP